MRSIAWPPSTRVTASCAWPDSRLRPKRLHDWTPSIAMLTRIATRARRPPASAMRSIRAISSRLSTCRIEPPAIARASASSGLYGPLKWIRSGGTPSARALSHSNGETTSAHAPSRWNTRQIASR